MRFPNRNLKIHEWIAGSFLAAIAAVLFASVLWAATPPYAIAPLDHFFTVSASGVMQGKPGIAFDGTNFLAVWQDPRNSATNETDVYGTFITREGTVVNPTGIPIATRDGSDWIPSVVFNGINYFVVWVAEVIPGGGTEIYGARVTPGGTVLDPTPLKITTDANPKFRPISLAFDGTNYLIAWRNQTDEIRGVRVSGSGASLDGGNGFNIGQGFYPWVGFNGTKYLVAWFGHGPSSLDIFGALVAPNGAVLPPGVITISHDANGNGLDQPTVASNGSDFFVAWRNAEIPWQDDYQQYRNGSAYGARVSGDGVVLDLPSFKISDHTLGAYSIQAVYDGSNYFVVWHVNDAANSRASDLFGRRVSSGGLLLDQQPIPIATSYGHNYGPVIGSGADRYLIAWNNPLCGDCSRTGCLQARMFEKGAPAASLSDALQAAKRSPSPILANGQASEWTLEGSNTSAPLVNIWAFDENHVYVTTETAPGRLMAYNGTSWSVVTNTLTPNNFGLWGLGPLDIWTVGFSLGHSDGISVDVIGYLDCGLGMAVWGSSSNSIWTIGNFSETGQGDFYRYDGTQLIRVPSGTSADLWDLWGTASNSIHAVGELGTVLRYDGQDWIKQSNIPTNQSLNAVWGSNANNIFAVGDSGTIIHFNGTSWSKQSSGTTESLYGVWGFSGASVYAVGASGTIVHYDGTSWTAQTSGTNVTLSDVGGAGNTVRAVGEQGVILKKTEKDCVGAITPSIASFTGSGGAGSLDVTAAGSCNWTAVSNERWIRVLPGNSGTGNGAVSYSVAPNPESGSRTGSLTIAGRTFEVRQAAGPVRALLGNISTRLPVGADDDVLIEGFIVDGPASSSKKIIVRALGPWLKQFGLPDALENPTLEIRGPANELLATNNNWATTQVGGIITGDQSAEIAASGFQPPEDIEAAIIADLEPGHYTAVVRGVGNTVGTGLVDAYDLSANSLARVVNFSTRGLVQTGDQLMIAGFVVQNAQVKAAVRGIGPSLSSLGVPNPLPDTTLELRNKDGVLVLGNDNWETDAAQKAELQSYQLQPGHHLEAALITTLLPGQYTAELRGKDQTSGIGVVEVYFVE